jgi:2-methylcitrate dehydratase PrpD
LTIGATAKLAEFSTNLRLTGLPEAAIERGKLLALDNIGVALAAAPLSIGRTITSHVQSLGGAARAGVWGASFRTAAPLAALANGTLSSAQDFDAGWHLTTHTLPAAMAIGEQTGASGARVLEGFIAGYETGARLIEVIDSERATRSGAMAGGWYHVGFVGPIVSAIAAAKVLGLDESRTRQAIGSAAGVAGGVRRSFGTMAKAVQAGNSASQGVQAAMLASTGFGGDPDVLEAPLGLLSALGVPVDHAGRVLDKLGQTWELLASLKIKRFPACTPAHRPVQAVLQLRREHGFAPEDVELIEADFHPYSLMRDDPADEIAAGFSLPFTLAAALVDGDLTLDQMSDERVHDPRVRRLMARTRPLAGAPPDGLDEQAERVIVHLADGRALTGEVTRVDRFETPEELTAKFRECAARTLPVSQVAHLQDLVMRLDQLPTIGELVDATQSTIAAH